MKIKSKAFLISVIILSLLFSGVSYLMKLMEGSETSHAVTFRVNKDQTKQVTEFAKSLGVKEDQLITSTADLFLTLPGFLMNLFGILIILIAYIWIYKKVESITSKNGPTEQENGV